MVEKADTGLQEIFRIFLMIQRFCHILKHFLYSVHSYKILFFFFMSLPFLYIAQNPSNVYSQELCDIEFSMTRKTEE